MLPSERNISSCFGPSLLTRDERRTLVCSLMSMFKSRSKPNAVLDTLGMAVSSTVLPLVT